ncbi:DDE-type integrase/transposase/recombinase [Actinomyces bowdenii]|uniref:DDE-type integrase/transposase/recombinase n=1 Tax=Actinomyces bowdenii TaxID=131109 RepID=UPI0035A2A2A2
MGWRYRPVSARGRVVYLATVLDCATRKVVGYALADHMRTSLVRDAIDMAVRGIPHHPRLDDLPLRQGIPVHIGEILQAPGRLRHSPLDRQDRSVLGGRLGGVLQREDQEREGTPHGLPQPQEGHQRYCLIDRAGL